MKIPVAIIIFNRPETTRKVLEKIAEYKPTKLFVIADGPRDNVYQDIEKCAAARAIIDQIDWDCELFKNYSDRNLGCGYRPSTGISWVFENVEEAIILEDDCLPDISFFRYCEEMLNVYRNNEKVMLISGIRPHISRKQTKYSYSFSRIPYTWGWATWRRAWKHYDFEIKRWKEISNKSSWLFNVIGDSKLAEVYRTRFDKAYNGECKLDYWDYQWVFTCWLQRGFAVIPNVNLVNNLGIGGMATHTKDKKYFSTFLSFELEEMLFPLKHPDHIELDKESDMSYFRLEAAKDHTVASSGRKILRKFVRRMSVVPAIKYAKYIRSKSIRYLSVKGS